MNILLFITIIILFYFLYNLYVNKNNESFDQIYRYKKKCGVKNHKDSKKFNLDKYEFNFGKYWNSYEDDKKQDQNQVIINPNFLELQFHNDYRDVITAVNLLAAQKQLFNTSDKPLVTTKPDIRKIKKLVKYFINEVNKSIDTQVTDTLNVNSGWDEFVPQKTIQSGWDKQMKELGIPNTLYNEPAGKSKIKLLKIDFYYALETEDDMRITCFIIVQKRNKDVKDQMLIRINFWFDRRDINEDRNFFDDEVNPNKNQNLELVIEEIFIIGYLTDITRGVRSKRENFYNYEGITDNDGMMNQKEILRQLMQKHKDRALETNNRISSFDNEYEKIVKELPKVTDYKSYKNTRTIFDDVLDNNEFSTFNNNF